MFGKIPVRVRQYERKPTHEGRKRSQAKKFEYSSFWIKMPEIRKPIRPIRPVKVSAASQPPHKKVLPPRVSANSKRSAFLIMLGLPLFLVSSIVLYRRVIEGQEKRVQVGEYTPDGGLRMFTPQEKEKRDESTWFTWIFGKEN